MATEYETRQFWGMKSENPLRVGISLAEKIEEYIKFESRHNAPQVNMFTGFGFTDGLWPNSKILTNGKGR